MTALLEGGQQQLHLDGTNSTRRISNALKCILKEQHSKDLYARSVVSLKENFSYFLFVSSVIAMHTMSKFMKFWEEMISLNDKTKSDIKKLELEKTFKNATQNDVPLIRHRKIPSPPSFNDRGLPLEIIYLS